MLVLPKAINIQGSLVPTFLYGTAWKEDKTAQLTALALSAGFLGVDTANQRRHYYEEGVGAGLQLTYQRNIVKREQLFIQTKFTSADGQDHRKPYAADAALNIQVEQSLASSLQHLQTAYLDSFILHGPYARVGLNDSDWQVWAAMESLYLAGKTRLLGISNVNYQQLVTLYNNATIKPTFVQNRCFANTQWDQEIRHFCQEHGMYYQGFSLLTANQAYLQTATIQKIAQDVEKTIPQVIFNFAMALGIIPLTGTSSAEHMQADLEVYAFSLTPKQINAIENIALN